MLQRRFNWELVLPFAFFLIITAAFTSLWVAQRRYETSRIQVETAVTGDQVARRLSAWIQGRLTVAEHFARMLGDHGHIDATDFQRDAGSLQEIFAGFQALNFVDTDHVIRIVVPEATNLAALGRNLETHPDPSVPAALRRSTTSNTLTRSRVVDLLQGGKGFATYQAIRTSDGRELGFLNAVFKIQALVDNCLSEPGLRQRFWFRVVESDGRLAYESGPAPPDLRQEVEVPVPLVEQPWRLMVSPTTEHLAAYRSPAQEILPAAGVFLAALLAMMLRAFLVRRRDLLESQAKYRLLVENAADLIVKVDPQGRFLFVSPSCCRAFGKNEADFVGHKFIPLVHEDDQAAALAALEKVMAPPHTIYIEIQIRTKDGWRWLAWSGTAVPDGQGKIREIIGVGRDITDRKYLEAQLLQSQKLQAVGQLAGGIAHDFNNILHGMLGSLALIRDGLPPDSPSRPLLDQIQTSAERATGLTRQLLAFGRRQMLDRRPLDLDAVVAGMIDLLRRTIGGRIQLTFTPGLGRHCVLADATQIEQILLNLCVNARDAIADTGTIAISTGIGAGGASDGKVVLTVADDGCGMDAQTMARAFEPFFTTKDAGKGTGLGLATVFGIVSQHDGFVECDSAPGRGSVFRVYLPATAEAVAPPTAGPAAAPVAPAAAAGKTILLAEDNPQVRNITAAVLARAGYEVVATDDGVAALAAFTAASESITLCILDMLMPRMGGRETGEKMRAVRADLPILFTSGYDAQTLDAARSLPPNTWFLAKPFPPGELQKTVRAILG